MCIPGGNWPEMLENRGRSPDSRSLPALPTRNGQGEVCAQDDASTPAGIVYPFSF